MSWNPRARRWCRHYYNNFSQNYWDNYWDKHSSKLKRKKKRKRMNQIKKDLYLLFAISIFIYTVIILIKWFS